MLDQRGLPRAVLADEADDRARGNPEADVVERELRAETPRDVVHLDHGIVLGGRIGMDIASNSARGRHRSILRVLRLHGPVRAPGRAP